MKKLIFFLILVNLLTSSFCQNKFFVELKDYRNDITYDKVSFYYNKGDTLKKWNKYENIIIDCNNTCYSTKSFNANDTLFITIGPEPSKTKYWLYFGSTEVKNDFDPIIYDKLDECKNRGFSMIRENSYINGYIYKIEIDPDIYKTYNKRFYIIFKRIKND